jgi:hypothetical protein
MEWITCPARPNAPGVPIIVLASINGTLHKTMPFFFSDTDIRETELRDDWQLVKHRYLV